MLKMHPSHALSDDTNFSANTLAVRAIARTMRRSRSVRSLHIRAENTRMLARDENIPNCCGM